MARGKKKKRKTMKKMTLKQRVYLLLFKSALVSGFSIVVMKLMLNQTLCPETTTGFQTFSFVNEFAVQECNVLMLQIAITVFIVTLGVASLIEYIKIKKRLGG